MLEDYAKSNGYTDLVHFTDDGYSGGNFDRPGWKEMLSHAPDPRVNGTGGQGGLRKDWVGCHPVFHIPFQFSYICLFSCEAVCQQEFMKVFMAVQHEYPFRVLVGAVIPDHLLQGVWGGAGFHIPSVLKGKGLLHKAVRLRNHPFRLQGTAPSHVFRYKGRVILSYISAGPFLKGGESVLFHCCPCRNFLP